jgi:hypothetical protein
LGAAEAAGGVGFLRTSACAIATRRFSATSGWPVCASHRSFRHRAVRRRQECASGAGREAHTVGRAQDALPHASPGAKTPARMSRRATSCTDAQSGANALRPRKSARRDRRSNPGPHVWVHERRGALPAGLARLSIDPSRRRAAPRQRRLHGHPGGKPALLRKRCGGLVAVVAHQARLLFLAREVQSSGGEVGGGLVV